MARTERRERGRNEGTGEQAGRTEAERSALQLPHVRRADGNTLEVVEHAPGDGHQLLPHHGQRDALGLPVEQRKAHFGFQLPDHHADGRLAQVEAMRSAREAARLDRSNEGAQLPKTDMHQLALWVRQKVALAS